jgi:hypothetical protein
MKTIAAAFVKAKKSFAPAMKDKTNPHFRSKYADLGNCIDAVDDALLENGIAFFQETFEDESGVTVETVFLHESGEMLRCGKLHVPASKQDPQGYGSALTYCRRYSLMAACGIAPEDDDGNEATAKTVAEKAASAKREAEKKRQPKMEESAILDHLSAINGSLTMESLKKAYVAAHRPAEFLSDTDALYRFEKAKDARKKALEAEIAGQA